MLRAENSEQASRRRLQAIAQDLAGIDLVCSGTLTVRTKTCGKAGCRCATDPKARHGPYHEWTWRQKGRLHHKSVTAEQAEELRRAIRNYRDVQRLLERWERESAAIILRGQSPTS